VSQLVIKVLNIIDARCNHEVPCRWFDLIQHRHHNQRDFMGDAFIPCSYIAYILWAGSVFAIQRFNVRYVLV